MVRFCAGDRIGIVCCSDGILPGQRENVERLRLVLERMGLVPVFSPFIYAVDPPFSGTGKQRAEALEHFYTDREIRAVFDISGGNLANEVLDHLDWEAVRQNPKPFFGYSDLTVILNAICTKTGQETYLYQLRNLVRSDGRRQQEDFRNTFFGGKESLFEFGMEFLRGNTLHGVLAGGNIRCFLKLAGTQYWPDLTGKILFLEGMSGNAAYISTYASQLKQTGAFEKAAGILLGTFTEMEREGIKPTAEKIILEMTEEYGIPVAKTRQIGHGSDSKCLIIGKNLKK